jgi:PhnB protein
MKLDTYLDYDGNCEEAFRFYEKHLGGKVTMIMTHGQPPNAKGVNLIRRLPSCSYEHRRD